MGLPKRPVARNPVALQPRMCRSPSPETEEPCSGIAFTHRDGDDLGEATYAQMIGPGEESLDRQRRAGSA
jgi:hypothetical protein